MKRKRLFNVTAALLVYAPCDSNSAIVHEINGCRDRIPIPPTCTCPYRRETTMAAPLINSGIRPLFRGGVALKLGITLDNSEVPRQAVKIVLPTSRGNSRNIQEHRNIERAGHIVLSAQLSVFLLVCCSINTHKYLCKAVWSSKQNISSFVWNLKLSHIFHFI